MILKAFNQRRSFLTRLREPVALTVVSSERQFHFRLWRWIQLSTTCLATMAQAKRRVIRKNAATVIVMQIWVDIELHNIGEVFGSVSFHPSNGAASNKDDLVQLSTDE